MGLKNMSQRTCGGRGTQCCAGFSITVRGAAVAVLQEKWLTDINSKLGPQGFLVGGAAVASCTAAFLVGGALAGRERIGKCRKDPWIQMYHTGGIYRGQYSMDDTKDGHIQHTPGRHSRYYRVGVLG
jgi:hypothetical protein